MKRKTIAKKEKGDIIIIFLCLLAVILWFIEYCLRESYVTKGFDYDKVQKKIDLYRKENIVLYDTLIQFESFTYLYQKATEEGFILEKNYYVVRGVGN